MQEYNRQQDLAILGGRPVRRRPWPKWPRADANTERLLLEVLHSERWAISGMYNGRKLYERRFAEAFAAYHDVPFCVPTVNGSAALTMALEALDVGHGDEVLVPGSTWVACASSVLRVGAVPVLVDVEPDTLCLSVDAARRAVSPRTACIMLVHIACTVADLDAFIVLAEETGIPILEDCSQAHGAVWQGQRVGTFGKIGAFSMQDAKVLTCGEGGAAITSDPQLYDRMQQLRADGRRYSSTPPPIGDIELEKVGTLQGYNWCLSEFHAAILLDRLAHLDEENRIREQNGEHLRALLADIGGVTPLLRHSAIDALTYYKFCVRLDPDAFGNVNIESVRRALSTELGISLTRVGAPLNNNVLYNPQSSPRVRFTDAMAKRLDPRRFDLPVAFQAHQECLKLHHRVLLANKEDMEEIAAAFVKVKQECKANGLAALATN